MNLIIDIGNTQVKCALFEGDNLKDQRTFTEQIDLSNYIQSNNHCNTILSSVGNKDLTNFIINHLPDILVLDENTPIPIKNKYETPHTLGRDRLGNAVAANRLFPNVDCLIIDAGTCLKFDFVSKKNEYLGGSIAPGLQMRFKAVHTFTANLPLIQNFEEQGIIGSATESSIVSGCLNGFIHEIKGTIAHYEENFEKLRIVLTGGDVSHLENVDFSQKNSIFADRWLTLRGLNEILRHNAEK